jgi:hypothetical protein
MYNVVRSPFLLIDSRDWFQPMFSRFRCGSAVQLFATPPEAMKFGVRRYDAWRLPEADSLEAFVIIAVVADFAGVEDSFTRVGGVLDDWKEGDVDEGDYCPLGIATNRELTS